MSRLQFSLRAYPTGTRVTPQMRKTDDEFRRLMDAEREREAETARWIMSETGCTWGEALRMMVEREVTPHA